MIEKVQEKGSKLFKYFREEQAKHGNAGCTCNDCENDMIRAYGKLALEEFKDATDALEDIVKEEEN